MTPADVEVVLLSPSQLRVDPRVQRAYDIRHASNLAKDYSPTMVGIVQVSLRADGCYYLLDGQHRCGAAILAGRGEEKVLCNVWRNLTLEQEAELFVKFQQKRKRVSAIDEFRVGVTAGHPANLDIVRILKSFGLTVGLGNAQGTIGAVEALIHIYECRVRGVDAPKRQQKKSATPLPQGHLLSRTLTILTQAWGRDRSAFDGVLLKGVAALLLKHDTKIEGARLARCLEKADSPGRAISKIKGLREVARLSQLAAAVQYLEGVYNRRLAKEKTL